ncbi:MAG: thioredoxin domain-containing protein [Acidobacteriota bacterium]
MKSLSAFTTFGLATGAALTLCLLPNLTPALLGQAPAVAKQATKQASKQKAVPAKAAPAAKATPKAASGTKSALDKPTLEAYLRHMEAWVPQINVAIDDPKPSAYLPGFSEVAVHISYQGQGKDEHYFVSRDGKSILKGDAYDIDKNPFQPNLDGLKTDKQPSYGTAGAPVVMVVFGDFQCPLCKVEAEVMRANVVKTFGAKVQVYFKDFPLESIHPWARSGSIVGRCVFRQSPQGFWEFHDWIYKVQDTIKLENLNEQVNKWAATVGIDPIQLSRCIENKSTDAEVAANIKDGMALGIDATPTTFLNGRKLVGALEWGTMQALIGMELEYQTKLAECEKACTMPGIPSLLPGK